MENKKLTTYGIALLIELGLFIIFYDYVSQALYIFHTIPIAKIFSNGALLILVVIVVLSIIGLFIGLVLFVSGILYKRWGKSFLGLLIASIACFGLLLFIDTLIIGPAHCDPAACDELPIPAPKEPDNSISNQESIPDGWLKSPTFGFYYPQEMNIIEYYSDTSAVPMDPQALTADAIPTFRGTMPPDHDMVIIWGDHWGNPPAWSACTLDQYGPFVPGVSAFTCLNGYRTWVAHTSARNSISSEDLKVFGDFVIKNQ
jgi:hypothetical protein